MKIIILHDADARIEVLNVADHLIHNDVETFLCEHGYSVNNITWMAAPIDYVPVVFCDYGTIADTGEEMHVQKNFELKDRSIYDEVQYLKKREQEKLRESLRIHGQSVDGGYEIHFEDDRPFVAAYLWDEPCDVRINAVRVDKDGYLTILGEGKDCGDIVEIEEDDFFAGQLDYVTEKVDEYPIRR